MCVRQLITLKCIYQELYDVQNMENINDVTSNQMKRCEYKN